jgi:urea transport system substrate-binding protein
MRTITRYPFFLTLVALSMVAVLAGQSTPQRLEAQESLNAGIRAYRSGQVEAAINAFKRAAALDPGLIEAELHLANAYAALAAPLPSGAAPTSQALRGAVNRDHAATAIAGYERVLARTPDNVDAVAGLGRMYQAIGQLSKARDYLLRVVQMAPATAAPFFAVAQLNWSIVTEQSVPAAEQSRLIDDGLLYLERALAFQPADSDTLVFQNLLLREKARRTTDVAEKARLEAQADAAFDKALQARRGPVGAQPPRAAAGIGIPELSRPSGAPRDENTVRIGVLHSLTGTMAISETSLKDAVMLAVDEINASGGVLGKKIEPVVVDPASNWDTFSDKARRLLSNEKVAAVFGCWTSVSRKSVLPVFESLRGLLFYPVQYEGEEQSPNIIYTGAVPNQQILPAAEYLMSPQGGSKKKFVLLGTDYVYPRTANRVLRNFLLAKGVPQANIIEEYTPFGHSNYQAIVAKIREFGRDGDAAVLSTINGDSNVPFYAEFRNQGLRASTLPIMAFSIAEDELRAMPPDALVGHLAAWNYFQSIDTPQNKAFVTAFKQKFGEDRVTDDPIEAAYFGVYLWKAAVERADSFDVDKVVAASLGLEVEAPGGRKKMHPSNHHVIKPVLIGKVRADGQFDVVWKSEPIEPEAFSPLLQRQGR